MFRSGAEYIHFLLHVFRVLIKVLKQLAYHGSYYMFVCTLVCIKSAWMLVGQWNIFHPVSDSW